jgi:hypothetical protein
MDFTEILVNEAKRAYQEQESENPWLTSKFGVMNKLKLDFSGKAGERYLHSICVNLEIPCEFTEDKIDANGHYDMHILDLRVEVKTARRSNKKVNYQHEGLKNEGCDAFAFIDVSPIDSCIYLTLLSGNTDLSKKIIPLGKKAHLRLATDGVYKLDFSARTLRLGLEGGLTFKIDGHTTEDELRSFIVGSLTAIRGGRNV